MTKKEKSKRVRISFEEINKGNYSIIPAKDISNSRQRIAKEMKEVVRDYERRARNSERDAADLIINR